MRATVGNDQRDRNIIYFELFLRDTIMFCSTPTPANCGKEDSDVYKPVLFLN